jgi:hypothetical protein
LRERQVNGTAGVRRELREGHVDTTNATDTILDWAA